MSLGLSRKHIETAKPTFHLLVELARRLYFNSPRRSVWVLILMIFLALFESASLLLLIPVLQKIGAKPILLLAYVSIVIAIAILRDVQEVQASTIQQSFARQESQRLAKALILSKWSYLNHIKLADITHALTTEVSRVSFGAQQLLSTIQQLVVSLIFIVAACWVSPIAVFFTLLFGVLLIVLLKPLHMRARQIGHDSFLASQNLSRFVVEQMAGLKTVKSHALQMQHVNRFNDVTNAIEQQYILSTKAASQVRMWFMVGGALLFGGVFYVSLSLVHLAVTQVLTLLLLFARLFPRISGLQHSSYMILNILPGFASLMEFQEASERELEKLTESTGNLFFEHEIRFHEVEHPFLKISPINWKIPAKKLTAIVGPSGYGKTTLIDLLVGLYRPKSGMITIDGKELDEKLLTSWRQSIAYLTQDPFLFNDTIRANLLWGNEHSSDEEIWCALERAAADQFVRHFPLQLETLVGDRGSRLSGGERQRIALARVLLRKPTLLILDEVTNSLDPENQNLIRESIEKLRGKLTIVVITHQYEWLKYADQTLQLELS